MLLRIPRFYLIHVPVGLYIMSKIFTKNSDVLLFFSDFSDRLCETFNSEERDQ